MPLLACPAVSARVSSIEILILVFLCPIRSSRISVLSVSIYDADLIPCSLILNGSSDMTFWRATIQNPRRMWGIGGCVILLLIGLMFWKYVDLRLVHVLRGHSDWVRSVAFTPHGKWLVSADDDGGILVWDYTGGKLEHTSSLQSRGSSLAILPDSQSMIYADGDHATWALLPGGGLQHQFALPPEVKNRTSQVSSVSLSRDGKRLVVGGGEIDYSDESKSSGFVAVWDLTTRELVEPPRILSKPVGRCVISPDGNHVGYITYPSSNRVFFRIGEPNETKSVDDGTDLCFTPDSTNLLIEQGRAMEMLNLQDGKGRPVGSASSPFNGGVLSFSPDGKFVARGGASQEFPLWHHGAIQLYTYPDFDRITEYHSNENRYGKGGSFVSSIAISPDGKFIAAGSSRGQVRIWKMLQ